MSILKIGPPPNNSNITTNNKITTDWLIWFNQIYKRVGGYKNVSLNDLELSYQEIIPVLETQRLLLNQLEEIVNTSNNQLQNLISNVNNLTNQYNSLNNTVNNHNNNITVINNDILLINQDIDNIKNNINTINNEISDIKENIEDIETMLYTSIKDVEFNDTTFELTFTFNNDDTKIIDLSSLS